MTIRQLEEAGIRKVATKVTTTLNCLEGAVQGLGEGWLTDNKVTQENFEEMLGKALNSVE